jgi:hypothetical protein
VDRRRPIAALAVLAVLAGGCLGGASSSPTTARNAVPSRGPEKGTIQGRVFTTACGVTPCRPIPYRGSLTFCRTMGQIGFCPSAQVGADGRYRIRLPAGRYALVPAPARGNVVTVTHRWVSVGTGATTTLDINGPSSTD